MRTTALALAAMVTAIAAAVIAASVTAAGVRPPSVPVHARHDPFAGRLVAELGAGNRTVAVSPTSIEQALAMAYAGGRGATAAQIARTAGFSGSPAQQAAAVHALNDSLAGTERTGVSLRIANAAYADDGLAVRHAFAATLAGPFAAPLRRADFVHASDRARAEINAWVASRTAGRITDLLGSGDVDAATRLVLVDAVYLKARWAMPFEASATSPATFHAPSSDRRLPTMHQTALLPYRRGTGYSVLGLPYAGRRLELDVLLPDRGRMAALLRVLRNRGFDATVGRLNSALAAVALPKTALSTRVELKPALSRLGMPLAFSDAADLSGIAGRPGTLTIAAVVHRADIRIDEAGTEAAAATGISVVPTAARVGPPPVRFDANRPFAFALRDTRTGAILFAGVVSDPSARG